MKIMLTIGAFSYGGAERVMCALANHFCVHNDVVLVTLTENEETYYLHPDIKRINGIGWKNEFDGVVQLRKIIKKENPDVIISFLTHINIAVILASLFLGIPTIVSERNDPSKSATTTLRKVLRKITYPMAQGFVFQTEEARDYFNHSLRRKSKIIPNPLFMDEIPANAKDKQQEVVSVGRLVPQKCHDIIIKAFTSANGRSGKYHLTIYGNGDERDNLLQLISSLGMQDKITLHPAVDDLHRRIKYAKIFVLMSDYEGMPNSLMEAMGLGLACISTDCPCGGPRYLISDNVNGKLVRVRDEKQLEDSLRTLMMDDAEIERLGECAEKIRDRLSADVIFRMWDEYIDQVL